MDAARLVDLARYPLLDLASPGGRAAIAQARAGLAASGAASAAERSIPMRTRSAR